MQDFHVDGLRLDSVEAIAHWDFVEEFKDLARSLNRVRFPGSDSSAADSRFSDPSLGIAAGRVWLRVDCTSLVSLEEPNVACDAKQGYMVFENCDTSR